MTDPEAVITVIREWLAKADNDLTTAAHTLKLRDDCPTDTVCFHAQQCVEKDIKALLVFRETAFPKSHDISALRALLPPKLRPKLAILAHDLILRDPTTGKRLRRRFLRSFIQEPYYLTWTRNGKMLVGCAGADVHFVEVLTGRKRFLLPHPKGGSSIPPLHFHRTEDWWRAVSEYAVFQLYDILHRRRTYIKGPLRAYGAMKFSRDSHYLATAMDDSSVLVWDVRKLVNK